MSTQSQPAGQSEMIVFLDKLAKFHETLSPSEQVILDQMTATALSASKGEVQGYGTSLPTLGGTFGSAELLALPYYKKYYASVTGLLGIQL